MQSYIKIVENRIFIYLCTINYFKAKKRKYSCRCFVCQRRVVVIFYQKTEYERI